MPSNRISRLALALVFVIASLAGLATAAYGAPRPAEYSLPGNAVFPEGVAFQDRTGYFFVSSTQDGTIFRGHVEDEAASVFLAGGLAGRTAATGLKVDEEGRLFVSGAGTGRMFVYDTASGALLASFQTTRTPTFVNDVAVAKDGSAYFTDSLSPFLYRVFWNGSTWAMEEWLTFTGTPLAYVAGFNVNGVVATPDGKYLLVVQSNTGKLFRIAVDSKQVMEVDLGGGSVPAGDGLLLKGHRLYVVQNAFNRIAEVQLSGDYLTGDIAGYLNDPSFDVPTTAAEARGRLLVVNAQFNARGDPTQLDLPFTVSSVKFP